MHADDPTMIAAAITEVSGKRHVNAVRTSPLLGIALRHFRARAWNEFTQRFPPLRFRSPTTDTEIVRLCRLAVDRRREQSRSPHAGRESD